MFQSLEYDIVIGEGNVSLEPKFMREIGKLSTFDEEASKVRGFITVCKLYIRMRMREESVKKQI